MTIEELVKLMPGDKVTPLTGPRKGVVASVLRVDRRQGGWLVVRFVDGSTATYDAAYVARAVFIGPPEEDA